MTQRVELLMGCYRRGQAENPTVYVSAIAAVLSRYSPAVVRAVTDPVKGLPSKCDFLPTVKEVHDACEAEVEPERREAERRARIAASHQLTAPGTTATDEQRDRAVAAWEAQKAEMAHKKSAEEVRREAEERLQAIARENLNGSAPIPIGAELRAKLDAMADRS